jgi:photosystem II stability/assembly factor-like uncharacterized protein
MLGGVTKVAPARVPALISLALALAAIALLPDRAAAASGWQIVLDRPTPNFGAVDFVSDSEGWMPAGAGLLHTTDGGATWTENAKLTVNDVDFFDHDHGWAVGLSGAIYGTSDGGHRWQLQTSGTNVHLSDIEAISASEAWSVGRYQGFSDVIMPPPVPSALLHTIDGGATWQSLDTPPNSSYREIAFVGQDGWVLSERCEPQPEYSYCTYEPSPTTFIQRTRDGGQTWDLLDAPTGQDSFSHLTFADANDGWMSGTYCSTDNCYDLGDHSAIFRTEDGGMTWKAVDTTAYGRVVALAFEDDLRGWALARACPRSGEACLNNFLSTDDGGASWLQLSQTRSDGEYGDSLRHHTGVLFRTSFSGLALRSTDSGRSWQDIQTPAIELADIAASDTDTAFVAGGGEVLRTDDGGHSWRSVASLHGQVRMLGFWDEVHGIAAVWDCPYSCLKIYATSDGGVTWHISHSVSSGLSTYPMSLQVSGPQYGLLALDGAFITTSDRGVTWEEHAVSRGDGYVTDVDMADPAHVWAILHEDQPYPGQQHLARTTDGGQTWEVIPDQEPSQDLEFANAEHGWYIQRSCDLTCNYELFATNDGGNTWELRSDLGQHYIAQLTFADAVNGWALRARYDDRGSHEEIIHSGDGGRSWSVQLSSEEPLSGYQVASQFKFHDAQSGWLLLDPRRGQGIGGGPPNRAVIYHTTDGGGGVTLPDVGAGPGASGSSPLLPLLVGTTGLLSLAVSFALRRRWT